MAQAQLKHPKVEIIPRFRLGQLVPNKDNPRTITKRTGNELHPTQKPVELLAAILHVTDMAKTVADPFAGAGSTLIAAADCGRTWCGAEIDPRFCDVIRRRWHSYATAKGIEPGAGSLA
jgi:DNA modification methylase